MIVAAGAMLAVTTAQAAEPDCANLTRSEANHERALRLEDLIQLREIGEASGASASSQAFSLSPDGRFIAFQMRQANIERDAYCQAIVTFDLSRQDLRVVDTGGEVITNTINFWGLDPYPTGVPSPVLPLWSPDGRSLAFLKRVDGRTQVWRVSARGGRARQVTRSEVDVESFGWSDTGDAIVFSLRPAVAEAQAHIDAEAPGGYHYGERSMPAAGVRPYPHGPFEIVYSSTSFLTGRTHAANENEIARIIDPRAQQLGDARDGASASAEPAPFPARVGGRLRATIDGALHQCAEIACASGIAGVWIGPDANSVYFMRRQGWANAETALHQWSPLERSVRQILSTENVLTSCTPRAQALICIEEGSLQPRRIVEIDLASGATRPVFDPNPHFATLLTPKIERLHWRNNLGLEVIGDLVLPRDYGGAGPLPLVVVQYVTRGFLRGGVGDEYPVQAFADRGFAVLSFQRPADAASASGVNDAEEFVRLNFVDWADRRSVHSALVAGIEQLVGRGLVDPARIGITGLSDGASTVQFALVNSPNLFAAAALSTCCQDPATHTLMTGPATAAMFQRFGFPLHTEASPSFWAPYSLALNAGNVDTPILMQLAEDEYLTALESFTALREHRHPIDLYVFPGARHIKLSPAQRAAIYQRNLEWFDFWLNGEEHPDAEPASYEHWRALQRNHDLRRPSSSPSTP